MTKTTRWTAVAAAWAVLASCGGTTSTTGDAGPDAAPDTVPDLADVPAESPVDVSPDVPGDAPAEPDVLPVGCSRWHLVDLGVTSLVLADPVPVNTERTFRVAMSAQMSGCMRRAMPVVAIDAASLRATVTLRAWDAEGAECPTIVWTDDRQVALRLPVVGIWTIASGALPGGAPTLTVEVGGGPPRPCAGTSGPCEMDCDCPHDMSVCLGGWGLGGPFTECAHPCEDDMDCMNGGRCLSVDDGLDLTCHEDPPQCDGDAPCPAGYFCESEMCAPDFNLGSSSRIECNCDEDCAPALACAVPWAGAMQGRCEILCSTASPRWCAGGHFCGDAYQDLSGLALADSVCVWWGE